MKFSVHCPFPPNTYSYVREVNSGSTRKFVEIYLSHPQDTHRLRVGWRNLSKTVEKSSSSPRAVGVSVHVKFSLHPPSPPNTNSYVREVNLSSTRKFVEIYLSHPRDTHPLRMGWRNLSKTAEKSSSSPRAAGVFL